MRNLTPAMQSKVNQDYATEPMILVRCGWASGSTLYAEKDYGGAKGFLKNVSDLTTQTTISNYSEISSVNMELVDKDGSLLNIYKNEVIPNCDIEIFDSYDGVSESQASLVFKGKITGGAVWDEGTRTMTLSAESITSDSSVVLVRTDADEAIPLVMGTVKDLPATKVISACIGTLKGSIDQDSGSFEIENVRAPNGSYNIIVESSKYRIGYSGSLNNGTFSISAKNRVLYTNITISNPLGNVKGGATCIVSDQSVNLSKTFCYMPGVADLAETKALNFCKSNNFKHFIPKGATTAELVSLAEFEADWNFKKRDEENDKDVYYRLMNGVGGTVRITQVAGAPKSSWGVNYVKPTKSEYDPIQESTASYRQVNVNSWTEHPPEVWNLEHGAKVFVEDRLDTWVGTSVPSTITGVKARRTLRGQPILADVPSKYYTMTSFGGMAAVAMKRPLSTYLGENWSDDEVYLCVASTIGSNTASQIKYLVDTFTNIATDSNSFAAANAAMSGFPSNFAIFTEPEVLQYCREIAWLAKCSLNLRNGILKLQYLPQEPSSVFTLDYDTVLEQTTKFSNTPYDNLVTRYVGKYQDGYSGDKEHDHEVIYENNINLYGDKKAEVDYFIYNNATNVLSSISFWGYRNSNLWRWLECKTPLTALILEAFDCANVSLPLFAGSIRSVVQSVSHDVPSDELDIETLVVCRIGTTTYDPKYFQAPPGASDSNDCRLIDYVPDKDEDDSADAEEDQRVDTTTRWSKSKDDDDKQPGQDDDWKIEITIPDDTYYGVPFRLSYYVSNNQGPVVVPPSSSIFRPLDSSKWDVLPSLAQIATDSSGHGSIEVRLQNVVPEELPTTFNLTLRATQGNAVSNNSTHKMRQYTIRSEVGNGDVQQDAQGRWIITPGERYKLVLYLYESSTLAAEFNGEVLCIPNTANISVEGPITINHGTGIGYFTYNGDAGVTDLRIDMTVKDDAANEVGTGVVNLTTGESSAVLALDILAGQVRVDQDFQVQVTANLEAPEDMPNKTLELTLPGGQGTLTNTTVTLTETSQGSGVWRGTVTTKLTDIEPLEQVVLDVFIDPLPVLEPDTNRVRFKKKIMTGMQGLLQTPITIKTTAEIKGNEEVASDIVHLELIAEGTPLVKEEPVFLLGACNDDPLNPPFSQG